MRLSPRDQRGPASGAIVAVVGGGFLPYTLMLAGLAPLAGFVGKLAIIAGLVGGTLSAPISARTQVRTNGFLA